MFLLLLIFLALLLLTGFILAIVFMVKNSPEDDIEEINTAKTE